MIHKSIKSQILREVVLHSKPHTLVRPVRRVSDIPSALSAYSHPHQDNPLHLNAAAVQQESVAAAPSEMAASTVSLTIVFEQARREGYAEGLEEGRRAGFEEGHSEGLLNGERAGRQMVESAYRERIERLDQLLTEIPAQVAQRMGMLEDDMVDIVYGAVCRIVGNAAVSPVGVRDIVQNGIAQQRARLVLTIRVHPHDYAALESDPELARFLSKQGVSPAAQWSADPCIELGGCVLDTSEGSLDARLETQLQRLRETLLEVRRMQVEGEHP